MAMQTSSFNLIQTVSVLQRRWKTLLFFVIASIAIAAVTVFLVPKYFRSAATLVPANSVLADKGRIFNPNLNALYSYFGSGDDLDRVLGLADLETTYLQLVDEFSLVDYYKLKGDSTTVLRKKAVRCLKKDISFKKTEQGQLKIIAWTKDKKLSADLINRMVAIVQETGTQIWQKNYTAQITAFDSTLAVMQQQYNLIIDSVKQYAANGQASLKAKQLNDRIESFSKVSDEFKIGSQTLPPLLYVVEAALPAAYAERPDKTAVIIAAALLALAFGCILVLVNDRKTVA